jgi:predicted CXXCH cytochrome family protein
MATRCSIAWRSRGLLAGLAISIGLSFLGCSTPQQRYRVLSTFFDGVPDPDAPKKTSGSRRVGDRGRVTIVHKPYQENKCDACHLNTADIFARAQVRPDVCMDCHAIVPKEHRVMHGPVVNNACGMCHSPHSSGNAHLLRQPAPAVCTQCHEPAEVTALHKQPFDVKRSCIECHSGHGGTDHKLLLAEYINPPATQRAEAPR